MKIYIIGKINGDPNFKEKFAAVEDELVSRGHIVINPAKYPDGLDAQTYMRYSFTSVEAAELIVELPCAVDSPGAGIEARYARYIRRGVVTLAEFRRHYEIIDSSSS